MKETLINLLFNKILNPNHPVFKERLNYYGNYTWVSANLFECRNDNCYFTVHRIDDIGEIRYTSVEISYETLIRAIETNGTKNLYLNNNSAMYNFKWGKNAK